MNGNTETDKEERRPRGGWLREHFGRFINPDIEDDESDTIDLPEAANATIVTRASGGSTLRGRSAITALRLDNNPRHVHVSVRRAIHSFEDARRAADGLKDGQQQIVNLEQTPADMTERITDFLNGATYALEGSVEKIGDQVFLFTPSTVTIEVEDKPVAPGRAAFLNRE
jgi:FtsZ-interacting cell division protein YlmF